VPRQPEGSLFQRYVRSDQRRDYANPNTEGDTERMQPVGQRLPGRDHVRLLLRCVAMSGWHRDLLSDRMHTSDARRNAYLPTAAILRSRPVSIGSRVCDQPAVSESGLRLRREL